MPVAPRPAADGRAPATGADDAKRGRRPLPPEALRPRRSMLQMGEGGELAPAEAAVPAEEAVPATGPAPAEPATEAEPAP